VIAVSGAIASGASATDRPPDARSGTVASPARPPWTPRSDV